VFQGEILIYLGPCSRHFQRETAKSLSAFFLLGSRNFAQTRENFVVSLHALLKKRFAIFKDLFGQDFGILQCSFLFCIDFHTFCIGEGTAVSAFISRGVSHWGLAI
jgi:hypothetical protein